MEYFHEHFCRIFNSEKYLNGEVTVFHASFVAACVRSQNTTIGQYVLPPAELHEAIQERIGPFIWANSKAMQHIKDVNQQGLKTSRQGIKRRLRATNTTRPDANRRTSFEDSGIHMTLQENNVNENEICSAERNGDDFEPVPVNSCCQIKQHNHQVNNFLTSWEGRRAEGRERAGFLAAFTWLDDRTFPEHQVPKNGQGQLNPEEARRGDLP
uniref:Uncharacterized protein n=1 Tax=Eptatretus burgeri TaxID=7764 RepID=A0A8C4QLQ6_EPTBU